MAAGRANARGAKAAGRASAHGATVAAPGDGKRCYHSGPSDGGACFDPNGQTLYVNQQGERGSLPDGPPKTRAVITSTCLLAIILSWNEAFWSLNLTGANAAPLTAFIASFSRPEGLFWAKLSAASTMAIAPMVFGWMTQRQLVRGLTFGAVNAARDPRGGKDGRRRGQARAHPPSSCRCRFRAGRAERRLRARRRGNVPRGDLLEPGDEACSSPST